MNDLSENHASSQTVALAAACCAGALWGSGALIVNVLVAQYGLAPENISFWRFFIGAVVLVLIFGRRIDWHLLMGLIPKVVLAGMAMAGYVLFWFLGIEQLGAAVPTLIALCLPPVMVTIVAVVRGQERADLMLLLILVAAIAGTFLIVSRHSESSMGANASVLLGVIFSIGSAVLYAGFSMTSGQIAILLGAGPATACLTVVAALTMGVFALYRPLSWPADMPVQAWLLYLGVVTAALALLAFSWGAARLRPTALTVATLLEPLTVVVLSALLLGQHLSPLQWIGGGLLLSSICALGLRTTKY